MKKEDTLEYIDRYLNGDLSKEECVLFENTLSMDPELQLQVQRQKIANQLLFENRLNRLKKNIKQDLQTGVADKIIARRKFYRILGTGFGILVVSIGILITATYFHNPAQDTNNLKSEQPIMIDRTTKQSINTNGYQKEISLNPVSKTTTTKTLQNDKKIITEQKKEGVLNLTSDQETLSFKTDNEIKNNDNTEITDKENSCRNTTLLINGRITETCLNKKEGILDLSVTGGIAPYQFGIKQPGAKDIKWEADGKTLFDQLPAGRYQVLVKDKNECLSHLKEFIITEKNCNTEETEEYSFRPEYEEKFTFPAEDAGNIVIYDRSGKVILQSELHKENEFVWDGTDLNGRMSEKGIYLFVVRYKAGNSKKGYITIY